MLYVDSEYKKSKNFSKPLVKPPHPIDSIVREPNFTAKE